MSEESLGWVCPRCRKVHSPSVKSCKCKADESATPKDDRKLLNE